MFLSNIFLLCKHMVREFMSILFIGFKGSLNDFIPINDTQNQFFCFLIQSLATYMPPFDTII